MKEISLTKGMTALIDDEDFDKVKEFKWYAHESRPGKFYARSDFPGRKRVFLHRFIMNIDDPKIQVDHIDGNKMNNTRSNLRLATNQENNRNQHKLKSNNTSNYRGVSFNKQSNKFEAYIKLPNKKKKNLGLFEKVEDAAKAFDIAAKEIYGTYCGKLNYE